MARAIPVSSPEVPAELPAPSPAMAEAPVVPAGVQLAPDLVAIKEAAEAEGKRVIVIGPNSLRVDN